MKRHPPSGSSPGFKFRAILDIIEGDNSDQDFPDISQSNSTSSLGHEHVVDGGPSQSSPHSFHFPGFDPHISSQETDPSQERPSILRFPLPSLEHPETKDDDEIPFREMWDFDLSTSDSSFEEPEVSNKADDLTNFKYILDELIKKVGADAVAGAILENCEVKKELLSKMLSATHKDLKCSLKQSMLNKSKKDRNYLLSLTPRALCEEFCHNSNSAFVLLLKGMLGISNVDDIFESQYLLNIVSVIYSSVSKVICRTATGYALLLTTAARDGGLREDSIKLFCILVHPRTSQKYDREVLAPGWDSDLKKSFVEEKDFFEKIRTAEQRIEQLCHEGSSLFAIEAAKDDLELLLDSSPAQTQLVWDNLNIRTKHRHERKGDQYSSSNLDWMSSLWIQDRINSNHMDHRGVPVKDVDCLSIKDMVPSDKEKDYIFMALIKYLSYRLVSRHPHLFKSVNKCIKPNRAHQFQHEMDRASKESTGELFEKSESRTEDLIAMLTKVQKNVHKFKDTDGIEHCYEKKIVSGDNKTEKNMFYSILRELFNSISFNSNLLVKLESSVLCLGYRLVGLTFLCWLLLSL